MTPRTLRLAHDLTLPLEAVSRTFGILAVRGAGKSNTAAVMAEEMFAAQLPFCVIDPVGSWYGLRSSADGTAAGLPIPIFGGKHGDVPLERGAGELIADLIVEKRLTCVLDLSRFESENAKKTFLLAFAQRLYQKNENPLHLFLEEADDYIPQKPMRDEAQLLRAWENIVRRGRSRGLGMTLITQRSAAVAKMVLTQVETLFAMRTTGPQDIAAIEAWVKYHQTDEDVLATLSSLEDGEAWVWSPHFLKTMSRHQIRRRHTFDSGATPKNVHVKETRPPATLADIDLSALQARMSATIEKAKADDPRELRKQITELTKQLTDREHSGKRNINVPAKTTPALTDADRALLEKVGQQVTEAASLMHDDLVLADQRFRADIQRALEEYGGHIALGVTQANLLIEKTIAKVSVQKVLGKLATIEPIHPTTNAVPRSPQARRVDPAPSTSRPARLVSPDADVSLGKGERVILTAVAQYPDDGVTREQLTILTGYKRSSRDTYLQRLAAAGFATVNGNGNIHATEAGVSALGDFDPLPTGDELRRYWLDRLTGGEQVLLAALVKAYPAAVDRDTLSEETEYKRSSRDTYLQRLSVRKLITISRDGVRAAEELFT